MSLEEVTMSYVYLEHHGIKGQRWGVRRYQNEDGSLTNAGRKRYSGYDPTATVKKSKRTKTFERMAATGERNAKLQDHNYEKTGNEYHKRSAEQWRKESAQNKRYAEESYKRDVFDKTATRQQKKEQAAWEENVQKNWLNSYNKAASEMNSRLDNDINVRWGKKMPKDSEGRWDQSSKQYKQYMKEFEKTWNDIYGKTLVSDLGESPHYDDGKKWCERVWGFAPEEDE